MDEVLELCAGFYDEHKRSPTKLTLGAEAAFVLWRSLRRREAPWPERLPKDASVLEGERRRAKENGAWSEAFFDGKGKTSFATPYGIVAVFVDYVADPWLRELS